jgi:hypothetical protein
LGRSELRLASWGTQDRRQLVHAVDLTSKPFERALSFVLHRLVMLRELKGHLVRDNARTAFGSRQQIEASSALMNSQRLACRIPHDIDEDGAMFVGPSTTDRLMPSWHMSLARPLRNRDGSFAGAVVAMLRTASLGSFYNVGNIGAHGLVAIVGMEQGVLRFVVG